AGYTEVGIYANPACFSTVLDADAIVAAYGMIYTTAGGTRYTYYYLFDLQGNVTALVRPRRVLFSVRRHKRSGAALCKAAPVLFKKLPSRKRRAAAARF
ncbi:MAG: hypothetical protein IJL69_03055, partial [Oscillospiraceae bacterium]|nr:hypothetical protein [Oscillospiraceae bacterium]